MEYIRLPQLISIKIDNYSLFKGDLSYEVKKGLNIFIGANGLGKTTTTSLIIYGLVGFTHEKFTNKEKQEYYKLDSTYFENRSRNKRIEYKQETPTTVSLEFTFSGVERFIVVRDLVKDQITNFSIDGIEQNVDVYKDKLQEYAQLNLADLAFLLEFFLIREEEGNYLLWDFKKQSKLLQLLINPVGFRKKYRKLEERSTELNSRINRTLDRSIGPLKNSINDLKKKKEEKTSSSTAIEIEAQILQLEEKIKQLNRDKDDTIRNLEYILSQLRDFDTETEILASEIETTLERITSLEGMLYRHVYSDEKVNTVLHKLRHYRICIFCNTKNLSESKKKEIIQLIEIRNSCPVCSSPMGAPPTTVENPERLLSEVESENNKIETLELRNNELVNQKAAIEEEYTVHQTRISRLNKEINEVALTKLELELKLSKSVSPENDIDVIDLQIKNLQEQVEALEEELQPDRDEFKLTVSKLKKINETLTKKTNKSLAKLNEIFSELAKKYFKEDCLLEIHDKKLKTSLEGVRQSYYVPFFDGKKRTIEKNCSTSERLFLEYLFRLSILRLYKEQSGSPVFIIMETSEGAFDIGITQELAHAFVEFSLSEISTIIIANFSKKDYLKELIKGIDYDEERVLNYLDFSALSKQQSSYIKTYSDTYEEIFNR